MNGKLKQLRFGTSGLRDTVDWYIRNAEWVKGVRTGEYMKWIEKNYVQR